jgi:very-short-patch-repair endonuclease
MSQRSKTTPRIRGTTPEIEAAARRLRRNMTPAERKLWEALKGKKLGGLKFRPQHPVGPFILDFYCPARKLVVELDGGVHEEQAGYDEARTDQLENYGYRVIRFRNEEVLENLPAVLERILEAARGSPSPP